ncbi:hypothetical protein AB0G29_35275, partial [Streptomyces parvus]|uniref:hypothetical protein n=1 Tax=Streptomyces parvus TaxID=66428 RepID=UPI0033E46540
MTTTTAHTEQEHPTMTEQPEQQQTVQQTEDECAFPDCRRPRVPKDPTVRGTRPRYCDNPDHNASSAFKERRAREATAAGRVQPIEEDLDRPVSTAAATRVHVGASVLDAVKTLETQLPRYLEILEQLNSTEAVEAEVHNVSARADFQVTEAQKELADERTRRDSAERRAKTAEDAKAEADEAADEAHQQLEAAKVRFEAETKRIQEEAAAAIAAAEADRNAKVEEAAADAAERIAQVEERTAQEVTDIEQKAGEERVERDRQLEAAKAQFEAETKRIQEEAAAAIAAAEADRNAKVEEAAADAAERIAQVEERTAQEVTDIEQKAGEERVERDRQL